uniref:Uncharacterized protein n=1 Tax=Desertifilum tharense IPPAS B-1220 TaxID=1781255 RepID=A0A1E5QK90_9CYAN|nr:hypothetical protein BH720_11480 [Desertifilum tharense IPPAS B-1220]
MLSAEWGRGWGKEGSWELGVGGWGKRVQSSEFRVPSEEEDGEMGGWGDVKMLHKTNALFGFGIGS